MPSVLSRRPLAPRHWVRTHSGKHIKTSHTLLSHTSTDTQKNINKYTSVRHTNWGKEKERERQGKASLKGGAEEETECNEEEEFYHGIRFQWENEVQHFITGRYLPKCKHRLGISKVKLCVCVDIR